MATNRGDQPHITPPRQQDSSHMGFKRPRGLGLILENHQRHSNLDDWHELESSTEPRSLPPTPPDSSVRGRKRHLPDDENLFVSPEIGRSSRVNREASFSRLDRNERARQLGVWQNEPTSGPSVSQSTRRSPQSSTSGTPSGNRNRAFDGTLSTRAARIAGSLTPSTRPSLQAAQPPSNDLDYLTVLEHPPTDPSEISAFLHSFQQALINPMMQLQQQLNDLRTENSNLRKDLARLRNETAEDFKEQAIKTKKSFREVDTSLKEHQRRLDEADVAAGRLGVSAGEMYGGPAFTRPAREPGVFSGLMGVNRAPQQSR